MCSTRLLFILVIIDHFQFASKQNVCFSDIQFEKKTFIIIIFYFCFQSFTRFDTLLILAIEFGMYYHLPDLTHCLCWQLNLHQSEKNCLIIRETETMVTITFTVKYMLFLIIKYFSDTLFYNVAKSFTYSNKTLFV
eukprot:329673_1